MNDIADLKSYAESLARQAREAAYQLAAAGGRQRTDMLERVAGQIRKSAAAILAANARDIAAAEESKLGAAMIDRLRLDAGRLEKIAAAVDEVAGQPDPVGEVITGYVRPNGLRIEKIRVPIGVAAIIFESRPNVTSDAAAICLKSGNACILRGGKEAVHTNIALGEAIEAALAESGVSRHAVQIVKTTQRELVPILLKLDQFIDVVIPRGGESLIRAVVQESTIPVIKHYTGNCHVFVHAQADPDMAERIVLNAKLQRPGVCNAAETILFDAAVAETLISRIGGKLAEAGCEVRGCERTRRWLPQAKPAGEEDWYTEYLDKIVAIAVVDGVEDAIRHINKYSSHHTDAIVTRDLAAAEAFVMGVDSASVMVNASTRFSDGGEYGLGAEIGISTDKLHARGPMGAADLTTYKYVVRGAGHVRG